jgi:hypothetical protein
MLVTVSCFTSSTLTATSLYFLLTDFSVTICVFARALATAKKIIRAPQCRMLL